MESDKYIAICETTLGRITIVDMSDGNTVTRHKMFVEAAIMNPVSKVVALRGELWIYNICIKMKIPTNLFLSL
jgi:clathrin heavy chain